MAAIASATTIQTALSCEPQAGGEAGLSLDFRTLDGWHADGDWFYHFLDSPEEVLLIIPLLTDIKPGGGGTAICTDGISLVAQRLVCL